MEKESRSLRASRGAPEPDLFLQWGNRKRLGCIKAPDDGPSGRSDGSRRRVNRRLIRGSEKDLLPLPPPHSNPLHHHLHHRKSESAGSKSRKQLRSVSSSPEEDRFYSTIGATAAVVCEENGNGSGAGGGEEKGVMVLPRFFLSLSNKEKEEDFMAMKGFKLPQRPKKRSKFIQKTILLVSPGAWLTDLSQERYEVREKKSSRKKRGLKAMCMDTDSEWREIEKN